MRALLRTFVAACAFAANLTACLAVVDPIVTGESAFSRHLSKQTFNETTADGTWLVEFYLPTCSHCQRLAPTWMKLAEDSQELRATKNFHFAKVNCALEQEFCNDVNIMGVPTLNLYQSGKFLKEYQGDHAYDALEAFVKDESHRINNPLGMVVSLSADNFDEFTRNGPWMVEFFAPWCGHCQNLAPIWEELGHALKTRGNVGKVDCTVETDLCSRHQIRGYPTIKMVQDGVAVDFRGPRSLERLLAFAERAIASRLQWIQQIDILDIKEGNEVAFILNIPEDTATTEKENYIRLAQSHTLKHRFFVSSDPEVASSLKVSRTSLAVLKDNEVIPYVGALDADDVKTWIDVEHYPLLSKLDSDTAPDILDSAFTVVLAVVEPETPSSPTSNDDENSPPPLLPQHIESTFRAAAKTHRDWQLENDVRGSDPTIFAWIDGTKWTEYVNRVYGVRKEDMPVVVVAKPSRDMYWDKTVSGNKITVDEKVILEALRNVGDGTIAPKYTVGFMKRIMKRASEGLTTLGISVGKRPFTTIAIVAGFTFLAVFLFVRAAGTSETSLGPKAE